MCCAEEGRARAERPLSATAAAPLPPPPPGRRCFAAQTLTRQQTPQPPTPFHVGRCSAWWIAPSAYREAKAARHAHAQEGAASRAAAEEEGPIGLVTSAAVSVDTRTLVVALDAGDSFPLR